MTVIYVPTRITSAEQAEQLPDGAIPFNGDPAEGDTYYHAKTDGEWHVDGYPATLSRAIQFGCTVTALMPVEAAEERTTPLEPGSTIQILPSYHWFQGPVATRLVTPWEPTP